MTRRERIAQIDEQVDSLFSRAKVLMAEKKELLLQEFKAEYSCTCVKRNEDIEIFNMTEQRERGRVALELGMVYDTHSARLDCIKCKGTGKPK